MIKWGLVSKHDFVPRFEYLSSYLSEKHGLENSFESLDCEPDDFFENIDVWLKEYDQLRVGPPFGSLLAKDMDRSNATTMAMKTSDCMHKVDGSWWPRSLLEEALLRSVIRAGLQIDIHSKAMVIGTGASAKAAIMPLVKLGYNEISFTDREESSGYEFVQEMRKRVFSTKFNFIEQRDISLLPGAYSFVLNTTPDMEGNTLVEDLSYFNYLKSGGVAVDLSVHKKETTFVAQAELVMAQVLPGFEVAADVDAYWAEMCFDVDIDLKAYAEGLMDKTK